MRCILLCWLRGIESIEGARVCGVYIIVYMHIIYKYMYGPVRGQGEVEGAEEEAEEAGEGHGVEPRERQEVHPREGLACMN